MHSTIDPGLVALSILIALIASYTALDLAGALAAARGRARLAWLAAGALAMGVGIWSMHFVGMLAFSLRGVRVAYDLALLIASVAIAIAASALALLVASRPKVSGLVFAAAGLAMGAAIAGMHYVAIASMRMPAAIRWQPTLVAASIALAMLASFAGFGYVFRVRREDGRIGLPHRLIGGLLLGLAISGMHFTAMGALRLSPGPLPAADGPLVIATEGLAVAVALATLVILAITIAGSVVDRALARRMDLAIENEGLFRDAERARTEAERARAESDEARAEADQARRRAERRAAQEQVLRGATRELGAAETVDDVAELLVRSALALAAAAGAYVEARDRHSGRGTVEVIAVHGRFVPKSGTRVPYPGSLTEEIIESSAPGLLREIDRVDETIAPYLRSACADCTVLAAPLVAGGAVEGALVLLREAAAPPFSDVESRAIAALADTAAAALRRVELGEALRESEQRLRQLAENIREVFWVLDLDSGCMSYVSPGYEQIWGRNHKELYKDALAFTRAVHPEDRQRVEAAFRSISEDGYDVEYRIIRPDGEQRWIHARGSPVRDGRGRVFRIAGIAEDITGRKEVEQAQSFLIEAGAALASSLDYHETLCAAARQAVPQVADWCAIDVLEEGTIRRLAVAHPDAEREAMARELAERYPPDPDDPTGVPNVLRTGQAELIRHVDDNLLMVSARDDEHLRLLREIGIRSAMIVPMSARGRTLGAITLVAAESGRHYEEKDLGLAQEMATRAALAVDNARLFRAAEERRIELERATESRARLMRGFSHDLKNPLGAADGYAQLLEDGMYGELNPEQQKSVVRLRSALAGALRLISDLLELARAETGQVDVQAQPTDIGRTVRETVADYEAQAAAASLAMDVELCDGLPSILTDANRTRQVLGNLLSNALKYTPAGGGVKVRVCEGGNGHAPAPGDWVRVEVSDDGPGIPLDKQALIFEEFQRLDSRGKKGAGLGLAISRRIAHALHGEITLESEPGVGSKFTLWLPRAAGR